MRLERTAVSDAGRAGKRVATSLVGRPVRDACTVALAGLALLTVAAAAPLDAQVPDSLRKIFDSSQTDILMLRSGGHLYGEFKSLKRGQVQYSTDAMSTVYVKWPRILSATTNKQFEIELDNQVRYVGSLLASDSADFVIIRTRDDTLMVPTQSIVQMTRIKDTFFDRLDGNVGLGLNFTQQNAKLDLQLNTKVTYTVALHRVQLTYSGAFSRQDSVSNITRQSLSLQFSREFSGRWRQWFWTTGAEWQTNSQLDLDFAIAVGSGPGRLLITSNKVQLSTWIGLWYRRELYAGSEGRNAIPVLLSTDFELFQWAGLSTDLSSRLGVAPVVNDSGRWLISMTVTLQRELVSQLYLNLTLDEYFDSRPPTDTNRNDFSLSTSLQWSF